VRKTLELKKFDVDTAITFGASSYLVWSMRNFGPELGDKYNERVG